MTGLSYAAHQDEMGSLRIVDKNTARWHEEPALQGSRKKEKQAASLTFEGPTRHTHLLIPSQCVILFTVD